MKIIRFSILCCVIMMSISLHSMSDVEMATVKTLKKVGADVGAPVRPSTPMYEREVVDQEDLMYPLTMEKFNRIVAAEDAAFRNYAKRVAYDQAYEEFLIQVQRFIDKNRKKQPVRLMGGVVPQRILDKQ